VKQYRKCDTCGHKFQIHGDKESWKHRCGECAQALRGASITCGLCESQVSLRRAELVTFIVNPGKKGSKKFQVRYCVRCAVAVRAKVRANADRQNTEFERAQKTQKQLMHDMYGKRGEGR